MFNNSAFDNSTFADLTFCNFWCSIIRRSVIWRSVIRKSSPKKKNTTRLRIKGRALYRYTHITVKSERYTPLKLAASEIHQRTVDDPALDLYAARIVRPKRPNRFPCQKGVCWREDVKNQAADFFDVKKLAAHSMYTVVWPTLFFLNICRPKQTKYSWQNEKQDVVFIDSYLFYFVLCVERIILFALTPIACLLCCCSGYPL